MESYEFEQGVYTKKDFEPKIIFRSPSIKKTNKGKKYYTKEINRLFNNLILSIVLTMILSVVIDQILK